MSAPLSPEQRNEREREILHAIRFYVEHGWSWLDVVGFIATRRARPSQTETTP